MINTIITGGQYDDPTEWNGKNARCKLCDNDAENFDEYCEEHQRCDFCGEREECDCEEEMKQISDCCGARIDSDIGICYECKEHADNAWDAHFYYKWLDKNKK